MIAASAVFFTQTAFSAAAADSPEEFIYDVAAYVDPDNPLRIIVKWETSVPAVSRVAYRPDTASEWCKTPLSEEQTRVHKVTVVGLQENTPYFVRPVSNGVIGSVKICATGSLPSALPTTELVVNNTENSGTVITGVPVCSTVIAVDSAGRIVWYHPDSDGGLLEQFHLKRNGDDGRVYYQTGDAIKAVDYKGNESTILDLNSIGGSSHHDFLITPEGSYMYLSNESVYKDDTYWCLDVIVERDEDGAVLWEWHFSDHMDEMGGFAVSNDNQLYDLNCGGYDLTHANSVDLHTDAGGRRFVLISLRHLNRVITIDYETKEIVWQLGEGLDFDHTGGQWSDPAWFSCQHSARHLPNGSVLLFDNGNDRISSGQPLDELFSRCIVYYIDDIHMLTWPQWEFRLSDFADHKGDVAFVKDQDFLIVFPIDGTRSYSSLLRVNSLQQCTWKTDFYYPTQEIANKLTGILEIDSLYDLQE